VGDFCVVEGAEGLLVEGSELVGDVLDAFVLEPAGYAVEGAVAVAGCVVVLHVGLDGFTLPPEYLIQRPTPLQFALQSKSH